MPSRSGRNPRESGGCNRFIARLVVVAGLGLIAAACAQSKSLLSSRDLPPAGAPARVLLMPPDVALSELSAAGMLQPNAAWTAAATSNVEQALGAALRDRQVEIVRYEGGAMPPADPAHAQLVKLHGAVGRSILLHKYFDRFALPTKADTFDWSLGPAVAALREDHGADYALFVNFRDTFATSGRVAVIFVGALFGLEVARGEQSGFASLVDLRTGDIVWFSRFISEKGDLRQPDLARAATDKLLTDLPL